MSQKTRFFSPNNSIRKTKQNSFSEKNFSIKKMRVEVKKCARSKGGMTDTKPNETQHYGIIVTLSKVFMLFREIATYFTLVGRNAVSWFIMLSVLMLGVINMGIIIMSIIMMNIIMMSIIMMSIIMMSIIMMSIIMMSIIMMSIIMLRVLMLSVIIDVTMLSIFYFKCHHAECFYDKKHNAECHYSKFCYAECCYFKFSYAKCD